MHALTIQVADSRLARALKTILEAMNSVISVKLSKAKIEEELETDRVAVKKAKRRKHQGHASEVVRKIPEDARANQQS